jgi:hypothetical protein
MRWTGHAAHMEVWEMRIQFVGEPFGKKPLKGHGADESIILKWIVINRVSGCRLDWSGSELGQVSALVIAVINLWVVKRARHFLSSRMIGQEGLCSVELVCYWLLLQYGISLVNPQFFSSKTELRDKSFVYKPHDKWSCGFLGYLSAEYPCVALHVT